MPTLALRAATITAAERDAGRNWENNLAALRIGQPGLVEILGKNPALRSTSEPASAEDQLEWVFARDGSLTAMDREGKWWGNCSVPLLAGQVILKTLEKSPVGSCLLGPAHAGLVRAARECMGPWPVLFVVQPDLAVAEMILACHDFSEQIRRHRFWLVCGSDWKRQFRELFSEHPGLATPARFIRTKWTADEVINSMITGAQEVFSAVLSERTAQLSLEQAKVTVAGDPKQVLLLAGSDFRLWDQAGEVLAGQLCGRGKSQGLTIHHFDTDEAMNGSPLSLLAAARGCGRIVSANICRADTNQLLSPGVPWISWITQPAVPAFESAGPGDVLLLADPNWRAIARRAGWPEKRVSVCGWPMLQRGVNACSEELAMLCNTRGIELPETIKGYSSHRLLWDLIEEELHGDPLAVEKIDEYLSDRAGQLNIAVEALDRRGFIEGLILPAYQQGLARLLVAAGLPICLWGNGWTELGEFAGQVRGTLATREELDAAIDGSAGLVYCWPERAVHAIEAEGKPVVYRSGRDRQQLIRNARRAIAGGMPAMKKNNLPQLGQVMVEMMNDEG